MSKINICSYKSEFQHSANMGDSRNATPALFIYIIFRHLLSIPRFPGSQKHNMQSKENDTFIYITKNIAA